MKESEVICVDKFDNIIGFMPKQKVHELGVLHRAISVFIFNTSGHWLIQQGAADKYHSANLWTNTCGSHPLFMPQTD
jgi:isopentenyl-diphosphate delta-isomerase